VGVGPTGTGAPQLSGGIDALAPCERSHWATVVDVLLPRVQGPPCSFFRAIRSEPALLSDCELPDWMAVLFPFVSPCRAFRMATPVAGSSHPVLALLTKSAQTRQRSASPRGVGIHAARSAIRLTTQTKLLPDCASP
jgi:hypothetical protein